MSLPILLIAAFAATLGCVPAVAAQVPEASPVLPASPAVAPRDDWAGCNVGVQVGRVWQRDRNKDTVDGKVSGYAPADAAKSRGMAAGALLGCNWQAGRRVLGYEIDGSYSNLKGHADFTNPLPAGVSLPDSYNVHTDLQASVRGRFGYAMGRHSLPYVTGGIEFASVNIDYYQNDPIGGQTFEKTRISWTAGGGLDQALGGNWIVRGEYHYVDCGTLTNVSRIYMAGYAETHTTTEHTVRWALIYKFGP